MYRYGGIRRSGLWSDDDFEDRVEVGNVYESVGADHKTQ